jgi:arylsulfatase A-like enzyme
MAKTTGKAPNILLIAVDSLLADHMSCYGYHRLTTPHLDAFARQGTRFTHTYSQHIPTTPAYSSMLTGRDCFGTRVVALRHVGTLPKEIHTLPEICKANGYNTTCIGFGWNPASRGFDKYIEFPGWGAWNEGPSKKAENLNAVTIPEIERLSGEKKPFFMLLRHMDPHAPYLPPPPYDRMFYHGNEVDPANRSMDPVLAFKPFADFFRSWMPPGIADKDYVIAQYDGALAYMDACIERIFTQLMRLGILDNTIVVLNGDHGETLYDHECWFDHHGLYDVTLHVPLVIRYPKKVPTGRVITGYNQHKDLVPTLVELAGLKTGDKFDGRSLLQLIRGRAKDFDREFYITECTWMRKHGWRTPRWKLIEALEPDFHFKPAVELYDLRQDPHEDHNLAEQKPDIVANLRQQMNAWIEKRQKQSGIENPIHTQGDWHGKKGVGPFKTSQQAYDTLHIGDPKQAAKLQARHPYGDRGEHKPDETTLITIIGRGHSGTRLMSRILAQSGTYMGTTQNVSGDLTPPEKLYEACRVMGRHVRYLGEARWDFSALHHMPIDPEFRRLVEEYLADVLASPALRKGWKLPETTLIFPWIVRMFPQAHYIHWIRDPRDCVIGEHMTDNLAYFGAPCETTDDVRRLRALSWKYQADMIAATPRPQRFITVRFEDMVLDQDATLKRLSDFLGFSLVKLPVKADAVGRWKTDTQTHMFDFLTEAMKQYGYLAAEEKKP